MIKTIIYLNLGMSVLFLMMGVADMSVFHIDYSDRMVDETDTNLHQLSNNPKFYILAEYYQKFPYLIDKIIYVMSRLSLVTSAIYSFFLLKGVLLKPLMIINFFFIIVLFPLFVSPNGLVLWFDPLLSTISTLLETIIFTIYILYPAIQKRH